VGVIAPLKEEDASKPAEKPAIKTTENPPEIK
jgi:hypothetical protein